MAGQLSPIQLPQAAAIWMRTEGTRAVHRFATAVGLTLLVLALLPIPASLGSQEPDEVVEAPIALQRFQRGFMIWRSDNGQITVAFSDIRSKSGAACQEVYRDTYQGQPYEIPPAPPGLAVPTLGFGWLYANDPELAGRLGYALADEISAVAQIRVVQTVDGPVVELALSETLPGLPNPLSVAGTEEAGLTYCFARRDEDRAVLNTWVALQRFEYGFMMWRQDRPTRIEVIHHDTEVAPELSCVDTIVDTWRPGQTLAYGDLAIPGRVLPERGFGKVWLEHAYIRQSLGYPVEAETGGFGTITYETFQHPQRGTLLVRITVVRLPGGEEFRRGTTFPGWGSADLELLPSQACGQILIPHQPR